MLKGLILRVEVWSGGSLHGRGLKRGTADGLVSRQRLHLRVCCVVQFWGCRLGHLVCVGLVVLFVVPLVLFAIVAPSHADVSSDPDTAALLRDGPAEDGALRQAGELFGTKDGEGFGPDDAAAVDMFEWGLHGGLVCLTIAHTGIAQLLVQGEAEAVATFVTNGQIWKDEIASGVGPIEVRDARDGRAAEEGSAGGVLG